MGGEGEEEAEEEVRHCFGNAMHDGIAGEAGNQGERARPQWA